MADAPLVSVLLPVRDAAVTLADALDSLRAQTLEDFEVGVVDDGSSEDGRWRAHPPRPYGRR